MVVHLIGAALLAILCHGAGHWLSARILGIHFCRLRLSLTGLRLVTDRQGFQSYTAEAIVALSGPTANILGALLAAAAAPHSLFFSCFFALSTYLALLNLLPLQGFDGGVILNAILCAPPPPLRGLSPHTAQRVLLACSITVLILLWLVAIYLLLRTGSALALYVFCTKLFRSICENGHEKTKEFGMNWPNL